MKHCERVLTALNLELPDRCPMQISFTPEFAERLAKEMDLGSDKIHNPYGGGNTYELERAPEQDMLLTSVGWAISNYQDANEYVDKGGIGWKSVEYTIYQSPTAMIERILDILYHCHLTAAKKLTQIEVDTI